MTAVLLICAATGTGIALIVLASGHGWLSPDDHRIPRFCRMDEETCVAVLNHPDGRLLGIPNAWLGLCYYALVFVHAVVHPPWAGTAVLVVAWLAVVLGVGLVYSLAFRVGKRCSLCLTAHGINLIIALILTLGP
jgi:uncharacterized membrane protein